MAYRVAITRPALRAISRLDGKTQRRIRDAIDGLETNPRPNGSLKLTGEQNAYRIRVGDYRILYEIQDDVLLVLVVRVAHRREAYR